MLLDPSTSQGQASHVFIDRRHLLPAIVPSGEELPQLSTTQLSNCMHRPEQLHCSQGLRLVSFMASRVFHVVWVSYCAHLIVVDYAAFQALRTMSCICRSIAKSHALHAPVVAHHDAKGLSAAGHRGNVSWPGAQGLLHLHRTRGQGGVVHGMVLTRAWHCSHVEGLGLLCVTWSAHSQGKATSFGLGAPQYSTPPPSPC